MVTPCCLVGDEPLGLKSLGPSCCRSAAVGRHALVFVLLGPWFSSYFSSGDSSRCVCCALPTGCAAPAWPNLGSLLMFIMWRTDSVCANCDSVVNLLGVLRTQQPLFISILASFSLFGWCTCSAWTHTSAFWQIITGTTYLRLAACEPYYGYCALARWVLGCRCSAA